MLDVILMILSILGIILLVLLGIILAILLIVLFFPIGYKAEGWKREEGFRVEAKVNWLFRLIRVRAAFPEPGNVVVKALWFTLFDSKAEKKEKKTKTSGDKVTEGTATEKTSEKAAQDPTTDGGTDSAAHISQGGTAEGQKAEWQESEKQESEKQESEEKPGILQKLNEKKEKIKFKILNIYGKIKYIWENITFYRDLLKETQTQALLRHLGLRLKKILWSIRPRKINADIVFGASSPDTTGYCMAVYGILSPVLGKRVCFTPDFEQAVFKGEFALSGHITLFTIVMNACIFALDKKLRILIAKVKKFYNKQQQQKENPNQEASGKDGGDQTAA